MPGSRRFRVAFSFAGEKRAFVEDVAEILAQKFGRKAILYDKFHRAKFARYDLGIYLPKLYSEQSELIVPVLSPDYDPKRWTGWEWLRIHDLLTQTDGHRVMLSRFGFAKVEGLGQSAGFIELDDMEPAAFADLIIERLEANAKDNPDEEGTIEETASPAASSAEHATGGDGLPPTVEMQSEVPASAEAVLPPGQPLVNGVGTAECQGERQEQRAPQLPAEEPVEVQPPTVRIPTAALSLSAKDGPVGTGDETARQAPKDHTPTIFPVDAGQFIWRAWRPWLALWVVPALLLLSLAWYTNLEAPRIKPFSTDGTGAGSTSQNPCRVALVSYDESRSRENAMRTVFTDIGLKVEFAHGTAEEVLDWINDGSVDLAVLSPGAFAATSASRKNKGKDEDRSQRPAWSCDYLITPSLLKSDNPFASVTRRSQTGYYYEPLCLINSTSLKDLAHKMGLQAPSFKIPATREDQEKAELILREAIKQDLVQFVFGDPLSLSGTVYPRARLLEMDVCGTNRDSEAELNWLEEHSELSFSLSDTAAMLMSAEERKVSIGDRTRHRVGFVFDGTMPPRSSFTTNNLATEMQKILFHFPPYRVWSGQE